MNKIIKRQQKEKSLILEQFKKTPIVQIACEKTGVARATFYRWKKDDENFSKAADEALAEGTKFINDMAESQLMSAIRDKNLTAIIFWLRNHHSAYSDKVEIKGRLKHEYNLSLEQENLISKALSMVINRE